MKICSKKYYQTNTLQKMQAITLPSNIKAICSKKYYQTNTLQKMQAITFQVITAKEYVQKSISKRIL